MSPPVESRFLADPTSDPLVVRVEGRANFKNCGCVKDYITKLIADGRRRFVMDFARCTGMDSTFLGVLAGAALQLRKAEPRGSLVVSGLNERNRELVANLGLDRLLTVDEQAGSPAPAAPGDIALTSLPLTDEIAAARVVLDAHRNLVEADAANAAKFRDVLDLCARQIRNS